LNGAITDAALNSIPRNAGAQWFIPSENEWYKAAYHQPAAQGGDVDNYWAYPTRTNSEPNSDQSPGALLIQSNVANFIRNDSSANGYNDGYAVTGSATYSSSQNYLTDAAAYTSSTSPYGTFDQAGNVYEWNEALISGSSRGWRGGSWSSNSGGLLASIRFNLVPSSETSYLGFRVATVPEPSTLALAACAALGLGFANRRRRRRERLFA
jgi:formylglycine-generating enzyme required for sulfatase activity